MQWTLEFFELEPLQKFYLIIIITIIIVAEIGNSMAAHNIQAILVVRVG
jgi:hypothetical protein